MKKIVRMIMVGIALLVTLVAYTIWDNNSITLAKQNIVINHLPKELEGFRILQVTDLHGKEFGKDQSRLLKYINSLKYDAIVFTGDMLNKRKSNEKPFYTLLEGLHNKKNALYIPGNEDHESYYINSKGILVKSNFVKGIEKRGVKLLESVYSIQKNKSTIHFVDFEMSIQNRFIYVEHVNGVYTQDYQNSKQYVELRQKLLNELSVLDKFKKEDVTVALVHNPVVDARIDQIKEDPKLIFRDYDLILGGHYHGGQIRLPIVGALFVPESWYKWSGLFPPQNRVKGLWEYKHTKQYVSTGLGSSNAIPFLKFRLFNPPEINMLTLKQSK